MALGTHILAEFYGCPEERLNNVNFVEKEMKNGALAAQATIVTSSFHHFSPFGVSGVVVISESHLAIHTWPEYGYCAVDVFTCGNTVNPKDALDYLVEAFGATRHEYKEEKRGLLSSLSLDSAPDYSNNEKAGQFEYAH